MGWLAGWAARWCGGRWFFARTLPLVFVAVSLLSFEFPGDEYRLYVVSSHAGLPGMFVLSRFTSGDVHDPSLRISIALAGGLAFAAIGALLDWLRPARSRFFVQTLVLAALLFLAMVMRYPSMAQAVAKNGSLAAYAFASINPALELSALFVVLQQIAARAADFVRARRNAGR